MSPGSPSLRTPPAPPTSAAVEAALAGGLVVLLLVLVVLVVVLIRRYRSECEQLRERNRRLSIENDRLQEDFAAQIGELTVLRQITGGRPDPGGNVPTQGGSGRRAAGGRRVRLPVDAT